MNDVETAGRGCRGTVVVWHSWATLPNAADVERGHLASTTKVGNPLGIASVLLVQLVAGLLIATQTSWIVVGAVIAGGAFVLAAPRLVAPLGLACAFASWRVGGASLNMSIADVMLVVAAVAMLPYLQLRFAREKRVFTALLAYLVIVGVAVAAHPATRAILELAHRTVLVGGSLALGIALSILGLRQRALRGYVAVACAFALGAVFDSLSKPKLHGLPAPAYPFGIQKNPAAMLIGVAIVVLLFTPREVELARPVRLTALSTLFVGMLMCQSRGASIALTLVLVGNAFRTKRLRLSLGAVLGCTLLIGMVYLSLSALSQSQDRNSKFNPVNSRISTYDDALRLWRTDPLVGVGVRYFRNSSIVSDGEPHNLVVAALAETGLIGLAGTLVLLIVGLKEARRLRGPLGALAFWVLVLKLASSAFDIFWVAGTMAVPWILVGMALASSNEPADDPNGASLARVIPAG